MNSFEHLGKWFQKLDDGVLYCANKSVRAWNYTTGRTRADLASATYVTGFSLISILGFQVPKSERSPMFLPFLLTAGASATYYQNMNFKNFERKEAKNSADILDFEVETKKKLFAAQGYVLNSLGVISSPVLVDYPTLIFGNSGLFLMGCAYHLMRADYVKPRKTNILQRVSRRTKRAIKKAVKQVAPSPTPQPAYAQSLESLL